MDFVSPLWTIVEFFSTRFQIDLTFYQAEYNPNSYDYNNSHHDPYYQPPPSAQEASSQMDSSNAERPLIQSIIKKSFWLNHFFILLIIF